MTAPDGLALLVTADSLLLDELLAMAAAAGVEVVVADTTVSALPRWSASSLIVVAEDLLPDLVDAGMPRRDGVVVVARAFDAEDAPEALLWRHAVALGAAEVVEVPEGRARLVELLGDTVNGPLTSGPVISVVSGRGGAGASTLACALALAAEECLLVDADPLGGGVDLRLGAEDERGLRWPELGATRGRVSPLALRDALPRYTSPSGTTWPARRRPGSVSFVAASRDGATPIPIDCLSSVLEAGCRGFPLTVIDCPRHLDDATRYAWGRSRVAIVVVPDDVPGVVASSVLLDAIRSCVADIRVVVRRTRDSLLSEADIGRSLGHAVLGCMPHDRAIARGEPVIDAGQALRRFAQQVLAECGGPRLGGRSESRRLRASASRRSAS